MRIATSWSNKYLPAGVSLPIAPAGEIWSVVTESPNLPITLKPLSGSILPGSLDNPWKNVGFWIYVELGSKSYNGSSVTSISFHISLLWYTFLYSSKNSSGVTTLSTVSETSCIEGQMSCKYTSLPSLPLPIGSFCKSISTVPASA